MKAQCLPFRQIPHTTKLFADFLDYSPQVQAFYPRSPRFSEWFQEQASGLQYDSARRARVAAVLERQNRAWGASPKALENIARLRSGASAVVTGQQVGLFGGPLFTIFKAMTAVKLAAQASQAGTDCVPVFWLATEDHDLAEVNHVFLPGPEASLQQIATPTKGVEDAPVGTLKFGQEIESTLEAAGALLGDSDLISLLRESYRPGETFGSGLARLFARLFAEWGVILLDASDPELHEIAQPIYRQAIERAVELDEGLLVRGKELEAAGYHQQVKVTPASTLLFTIRDGARIAIQKKSAGSAPPEFVMGHEVVSQQELLRRITDEPQKFSANVLLRPVVQDYLLPTLAYTGGAAEVAYFAQAAVVYEKLLGRVTPVLPRFSCTLLEKKPQALLDKYQLAITDVFQNPEQVEQTLAAHSLPKELQQVFHNVETTLKNALSEVRRVVENLDKTLSDSVKHADEKMHYQLSQLQARAARAELRQTEILRRHAGLLSNALYPQKALQEREVAGIYFLARYGQKLLHRVYDAVNPECLDHQVLSLES